MRKYSYVDHRTCLHEVTIPICVLEGYIWCPVRFSVQACCEVCHRKTKESSQLMYRYAADALPFCRPVLPPPSTKIEGVPTVPLTAKWTFPVCFSCFLLLDLVNGKSRSQLVKIIRNVVDNVLLDPKDVDLDIFLRDAISKLKGTPPQLEKSPQEFKAQTRISDLEGQLRDLQLLQEESQNARETILEQL